MFSPDFVDVSLNPQFIGWMEEQVKNDPSKALCSFCSKNIKLVGKTTTY